MFKWFKRKKAAPPAPAAPSGPDPAVYAAAYQRAAKDQMEFEATWPEAYDAVQRKIAIDQRTQRFLHTKS